MTNSVEQAVDVEEVSAAWLSAILGYEIRSIALKQFGTGQTGATYRISVDADQGPATLILKVAGGEPDARKKVAGGYRREVGFYAHLAERVDIRIPKFWHSAISDDGQKFTLIFEDLAPRVAGVQADGCSLPRADAVIRNLAGLHAPTWNDKSLFEFDFLTRSSDPARAKFMSDLSHATFGKFVDRYRDELGEEDVATMLAVADAIPAWACAVAEPFALVHGDYRLDNFMFGSEDSDVVALDWQTSEIGPPTRDLAYFLGTCLHTDLRREHEKALVRLYFDESVAAGVKSYDFEQCFNDYRIGQLQGPMIAAIGCIYATGERSEGSDGMFLAMAKRSCAAIRDLESLELLKTLK